jgi:GntR family transcriptional regulator
MPLYHQLAEQLASAINTGQLQPGDPFENELSLADRLGLSRPTVRRAIAELVDLGLLVRRRGVGTTVANRAIHRQAELTSLHDDLLKSGRTPLTQVLEFVPATTDVRAAEALGLPYDTPLIFVERLRRADDSPISVMRNWLPATCPGLSAEVLTKSGLYEVLRGYGIRPAVAHQMIGARRPSARERRLLQLKPGDPLLTMSRVAFDATGNPVEFGDHCYRYDQYYFDFTVHEK